MGTTYILLFLFCSVFCLVEVEVVLKCIMGRNSIELCQIDLIFVVVEDIVDWPVCPLDAS